MNTDPFNDIRIIESWHRNAPAWVVAVREGQIESRRQVTDAAIIETVSGRAPRSVLDIGCGEGWLARELAARHIRVTGIDAIAGLVQEAQRAGGGDFRVLSYEELGAGKLRVSVDAVVCNFALFGKESVETVFKTVPSLLNPGGAFIVQTLHPITACGDLPYRDGWRQGSWAGFSTDFTDPAPWYFRTIESWIQLFEKTGFQLLELCEPIHPETKQPASAIFVATPMI